MSESPEDSAIGLPYPIAANEDNVYVVWADEMNLPQPHEILYRRSSNDGNTFGSIVNLSNTPGDSSLIPSIAAGNSVHVIWVEEGEIF